MAYDELPAMRMRDALGAIKGLAEKRMMGGVCFLLNGNMICGADRTKGGTRRFMFRVGKDNVAATRLPGGEPMVLGDRPMRGFYFVSADTCSNKNLARWLDAALAHARILPPKSPATKPRTRKGGLAP